MCVVVAVLREIDGHDCGGVGSCCFVCIFLFLDTLLKLFCWDGVGGYFP